VLVAELRKEEKAAAKEKQRVAEAIAAHPDKKQAPRLGKLQAEEQFPDVLLTEELPADGSLRALKPSLQVVKDQFARFQERHLIEPRKRANITKGLKAKTYDRYRAEDRQEEVYKEAVAKAEAHKALQKQKA